MRPGIPGKPEERPFPSPGERPGGETCRLPPGGEDLGDESPQAERQRHRRPGDGHGGQPDGSRHRPPHLQRLHEVLHLPEEGAGQHSRDRDPGAHRRAGTPLGGGDLRPADALEPPAPGAVPDAGRQRPAGAGLRHGSGGLHHGPSPDHGGLHGGRDRRAEDRTAAGTVPAGAGPGLVRSDRTPGEPPAGGLRRGGGVRHHGALGQELPAPDPPGAGAAQELPRLRRGAPRRHPDHRGRLGTGLRPPLHRPRCGAAPGHPHGEQPGPGHAPGERLPDGAAAHRRRQGREPGQPPVADAGGGDRRRPHRHRRRHRGPGLLRRPGGEDPGPLRGAPRREW